MKMKLEVEKSGKVTLLRIAGEVVTRDEQKQVWEEVEKQLSAGEKVLVMDLTQVPYVSSLGIAALVGVHVRVNRAGGELRLVNPNARVVTLLEATRLVDLFRRYSSVEEAVSA